MEAMACEDMTSKILNFNVGVLGHVDSGKTSLSKALSTVASTAAFDKNPQSKERGITLDLGFSSFLVDFPEHLHISAPGYAKMQVTLVDCPGHASLIRTIIGGAQIIDMMLLVIDIVKGVQTQTAECMIIGEILCDKMVVVLNKIDLIDDSKRASTIEKMTKRMQKTLENTKFRDSPIIAVAANPGGSEIDSTHSIGLEGLIATIRSYAYMPQRDPTGIFLFAVDHCFSIKGQGTVMTGTVLHGMASINDTVEISSLKITKKVKSMQMFHKPVKSAAQGDRVGICVTQFDPKLLERGLVCTPGSLPALFGAIVEVHKIPYFKNQCLTKSKFHITVGYETVMARLQFFASTSSSLHAIQFSFENEYIFQEELSPDTSTLGGRHPTVQQFVLLDFEHPIICQNNSLLIGSRLDSDINLNMCRLAFHGRIVVPFTEQDYVRASLPNLKIYKTKERAGVVERVQDDYNVIVKSLFKKETNLELFSNMKVSLSTGEEGKIEGGFGQSGKVKVRIPQGLCQSTKEKFSSSKKPKGKKDDEPVTLKDNGNVESVRVILKFKKYVFDAHHKMVQ